MILSALTDLYQEIEDSIRAERIADEIDRNPGTVRNKMQSLRNLELVEGISGPKGGYKPTTNAYEALDIERMDNPADIRLKRNGNPIKGVNIVEIDLPSVHHPGLCRAEIHLQGSVQDFHQGDDVIVGPTPLAKLRITGTMDGKDETNNILIMQVEEMTAPIEELS